MPKIRVRRVPVTDASATAAAGAASGPQAGRAAAAPLGAEPPVRGALPTGRVNHDDRGNAVWEWAMRTAPPEPDLLSTTQPLPVLENPSLSLAEDAPTPFDVVKPNPLGVVKGYNPYDSGKLDSKNKGPAARKDLRKLSEWIALRNQAAGNNPLEE